jgi:REP element-mobilizing transposase RayT
MKIETLESGHFYHIYNRGNNSEMIFFEEKNYHYFLQLLNKYIVPIGEIYAYCLLKNHFHFLIRLKEENKISYDDFVFSTINKPKSIDPSRQFSHFFNAYTQAVNKQYCRTGSLFEKPFERKRITDEKYLRQAILYIHNNPVKHGLVSKVEYYKWSSYRAILSNSISAVRKKEVLELFGDQENFVFSHNYYDVLNLPY